MRKLKFSTLFYIIGLFVFFILLNNIDFNKSEISSTKEEIASYLVETENKHIIKNDMFTNVSNFIILSAFIGLVIILFLKRKSLEEETNQIQEQSLNIEEAKREDINYLGRYCVDFNITIEDLERLTKEKSI
uniref:Uncharacterized protein n=1 Tax=Aliarcobacter butzleri TaxID=28197 RepID=W0LVV3_9BACT|nr:hypothetical protein [Aliarcobacter butzleri]AHG28748.1 hypothetical protein [Aliarcobacter butzleri]